MLWLTLLAQTLTIGSGGGSIMVGGTGGDILPDPYYDRIPLYYTAGRVNPSVTGCDHCRWQFWDGTYLEASSFDSTFASDGVVYLETNLDKSTLQFFDNNTDARFTLDLSVFRRLTYYLSLYKCTNITGDLSDVSGLTYYLSLYNCTNITGDLSDVSGLTYYLNLYNCSHITGDLSDVSGLTYYLNLYNCSHITGDLSDVSGVTDYLNLANCTNITGDLSDVSGLTSFLNLYNCSHITGDLSDVSGVTDYLNLANCSNVTGILAPHPSIGFVYLDNTNTSAADISQSLVNLDSVTTATGTRVFEATHIPINQLTAAGEAARAALVAAGWTVTLGAAI